MTGAYALLRVRGRMHVKDYTTYAMRVMGLTRKNHCTLLPEDVQSKRMIFKAKDYITWGTVDEKTVARLIRERGRVTGDRKITDSYVKEHSKFKDIDSFAQAVARGEARLKDVKGIKHYFRLNPPKKGFEREGIKVPYKMGGAIGDRADKMGLLLERMI